MKAEHLTIDYDLGFNSGPSRVKTRPFFLNNFIIDLKLNTKNF